MDNQYKFHKMTPSDDIDMGIYKEAMEYIFSKDEIRNIAITGTYGAGKSSMIESYKKMNPEKKFIHISLAHFCPEQGADDNGEIPNQSRHLHWREKSSINWFIRLIRKKYRKQISGLKRMWMINIF